MIQIATTTSQLDVIAKAQRVRLRYPRALAVVEELERCRAYTPVQSEPRCMLLTGESGVGKSEVIEWHCRAHPPRPGIEADVRPIVSVKVPEAATCKQVAQQILDELGAVYRDAARLATLTRQIARLTRELGIEQFIIDEVQHLVKHIDSHKTLVASDWFKTLINETKASVVLVGMPEARAVIACNPQLARRVRIRLALERFSWTRREKEFIGVLRILGKELPFAANVNLQERGTAARMFLSTHGNMSALMSVLLECVTQCVEDDKPYITTEMLRETALRLLDQARANDCDPWEMSVADVEERICRLIEPANPEAKDEGKTDKSKTGGRHAARASTPSA